MPPFSFQPRARRLERLEGGFDVAVIGGGITGAGVALDCQLRGLRVLLVERGDFASGTSSASSRLVHGGLRYLEHRHFALVRESLAERRRLLENARGLVRPERFVFPLFRGARVTPARLALGLGAYALLSLPRPLGLPRPLSRGSAAGAIPGLDTARLSAAFEYHDAATHDARLTLAVIRSAARAGAVTLSRVELRGATPGRRALELHLLDRLDGARLTTRAARVVLAAGPRTDLLRARLGLGGGPWIAPTRGTHLVVPRERLPVASSVILFAGDGRVLFVLPWGLKTAIGTTDLDADPEGEPRATRAEVRYLLDAANSLFADARLGEDDVVSTCAGNRPLLRAPGKDPGARPREERIEREGPFYTIAGGKLTGYRAMAEALAERIVRDVGRGEPGRRSPTRAHRLAGGLGPREPIDPPPEDPMIRSIRRRYGADAPFVLAAIERDPERIDDETALGEVDYACAFEDALSPADFLLRRSDAGLCAVADVESRVAAVASRMRVALGWTEEQERIAAAASRPELLARHAWREDPT